MQLTKKYWCRRKSAPFVFLFKQIKKNLKNFKKTLKKVLTNKKDSAKMLEFASEGTRKRMGKIAR